MYIVVRRGAVTSLSGAGERVGAAAVRCVREFGDHPSMAAWRARPGKGVLRARGGQWERVVASEPHSVGGEGVIALPPRPRSERSEVLVQMQAMTTALEPPAE